MRTVETRLMEGGVPTADVLVGVLTGLPDTEPTLTLVYRDLEAARQHLVDVFGSRPGELTRDADGIPRTVRCSRATA